MWSEIWCMGWRVGWGQGRVHNGRRRQTSRFLQNHFSCAQSAVKCSCGHRWVSRGLCIFSEFLPPGWPGVQFYQRLMLTPGGHQNRWPGRSVCGLQHWQQKVLSRGCSVCWVMELTTRRTRLPRKPFCSNVKSWLSETPPSRSAGSSVESRQQWPRGQMLSSDQTCFLGTYTFCTLVFFILLAFLRLSTSKSRISLGNCHMGFTWVIFKYLLIFDF